MALTKVTGDMTSGIADESGLASVQTFTSSGTWTKPSGITKVMVEVQGAGGSGSALASPNYCFGAGGGYIKKLIDVSSISSATITVGSGGTGIPTNGGAGNDGGNSIWADGVNTLTAGGGGGGTTNGTVSTGGSATGGDFNVEGQGGGKSGYAVLSGNSFLGKTNGYELTGFNLNSAPTGYGAGSGIGHNTFPSGNGGDGIVIVTEYK
jgi:hypothetical protein